MRGDIAREYLRACESFSVQPDVDFIALLRGSSSLHRDTASPHLHSGKGSAPPPSEDDVASGLPSRSVTGASTDTAVSPSICSAEVPPDAQHAAVACVLPNRTHPLGDKALEAIKKGLGATRLTLRELDLQGNALTWKGAQHAAEILQRNAATLSALRLGENSLEDTGCNLLCAAAAGGPASPSALHLLDLRSNRLTGLACLPISDALSSAGSCLTSLLLQKNSIDDSGCSYLARGLSATASLTTLSLRFNHVGDAGVAFIVEALRGSTVSGNRAPLTTLDLGGNSVGESGAKTLAEFIGGDADRPRVKLSNITKVNLRSNRVGNSGAAALAGAMLRAGGSKDLNNAGGNLPIPPPTGPRPLQELFLGFNGLTGEGAEEVLRVAASLQIPLVQLDLQGAPVSPRGADLIWQCLASGVPAADSPPLQNKGSAKPCLTHIFCDIAAESPATGEGGNGGGSLQSTPPCLLKAAGGGGGGAAISAGELGCPPQLLRSLWGIAGAIALQPLVSEVALGDGFAPEAEGPPLALEVGGGGVGSPDADALLRSSGASPELLHPGGVSGLVALSPEVTPGKLASLIKSLLRFNNSRRPMKGREALTRRFAELALCPAPPPPDGRADHPPPVRLIQPWEVEALSRLAQQHGAAADTLSDISSIPGYSQGSPASSHALTPFWIGGGASGAGGGSAGGGVGGSSVGNPSSIASISPALSASISPMLKPGGGGEVAMMHSATTTTTIPTPTPTTGDRGSGGGGGASGITVVQPHPSSTPHSPQGSPIAGGAPTGGAPASPVFYPSEVGAGAALLPAAGQGGSPGSTGGGAAAGGGGGGDSPSRGSAGGGVGVAGSPPVESRWISPQRSGSGSSDAGAARPAPRTPRSPTPTPTPPLQPGVAAVVVVAEGVTRIQRQTTTSVSREVRVACHTTTTTTAAATAPTERSGTASSSSCATVSSSSSTYFSYGGSGRGVSGGGGGGVSPHPGTTSPRPPEGVGQAGVRRDLLQNQTHPHQQQQHQHHHRPQASSPCSSPSTTFSADATLPVDLPGGGLPRVGASPATLAMVSPPAPPPLVSHPSGGSAGISAPLSSASSSSSSSSSFSSTAAMQRRRTSRSPPAPDPLMPQPGGSRVLDGGAVRLRRTAPPAAAPVVGHAAGVDSFKPHGTPGGRAVGSWSPSRPVSPGMAPRVPPQAVVSSSSSSPSPATLRAICLERGTGGAGPTRVTIEEVLGPVDATPGRAAERAAGAGCREGTPPLHHRHHSESRSSPNPPHSMQQLEQKGVVGHTSSSPALRGASAESEVIVEVVEAAAATPPGWGAAVISSTSSSSSSSLPPTPPAGSRARYPPPAQPAGDLHSPGGGGVGGRIGGGGSGANLPPALGFQEEEEQGRALQEEGGGMAGVDVSGGALVGQGLASLGRVGVEGRGIAVGSVMHQQQQQQQQQQGSDSYAREGESSVRNVMAGLLEAAGGAGGPGVSTPGGAGGGAASGDRVHFASDVSVVSASASTSQPWGSAGRPPRSPQHSPRAGSARVAVSAAQQGQEAGGGGGGVQQGQQVVSVQHDPEAAARQQVARLEEMLKPQLSDMADIVEGLQEQITRLSEAQTKADGRMGDVVGVLGHSLDTKTGEALQKRIDDLAAGQKALGETVTQTIPRLLEVQTQAEAENREQNEAVRGLHTRVSSAEHTLQEVAKGLVQRLSQQEDDLRHIRADQETIGSTAAQAVRNVQNDVDSLRERVLRYEQDGGAVEARIAGVERETAGIMQAHSAQRIKMDALSGRLDDTVEAAKGAASHLGTVDQQLQLLVDRCNTLDTAVKQKDSSKHDVHAALTEMKNRVHSLEVRSECQGTLINNGWQQPLEELKQRTTTSLANSKKALQSNEKLAQDVKSVTADWCDGLATLKPKIEELYAASNSLQGLTGRVRKVEDEVKTHRSDVHTLRDRLHDDMQAVASRAVQAVQASAPVPSPAAQPSSVYSEQVQTIITQQQAILERLEVLAQQVGTHGKSIHVLESGMQQLHSQQVSAEQSVGRPEMTALLAQLGSTANTSGALYTTGSDVASVGKEREELTRELAMLRRETQEAHSLTTELRRRLSERPLTQGVSDGTMRQLSGRIDLLEEVLKRDQKASLLALEAILAERGQVEKPPHTDMLHPTQSVQSTYSRPDRERVMTAVGAVTPPSKLAQTPSWSLAHSSPQPIVSSRSTQPVGAHSWRDPDASHQVLGRKSPAREPGSVPTSQPSTPRFSRHDPRQLVGMLP